jgi:hypothetical protein
MIDYYIAARVRVGSPGFVLLNIKVFAGREHSARSPRRVSAKPKADR